MAAAPPPPDPDSQMLSSPSDSDADNTTQTPQASTSSTLSPPDSQHRGTRSSNMPTTASGSAVANANGKRPLNTISNGDVEDGTRAIDQPRREFPTKTHPASGYKWDRAEDEPGYAWMSKKAKDEFQRAWEGMAHKDHMTLGMSPQLRQREGGSANGCTGKYGDPFDIADNERAIKESLQKS